MDMFSEACPDVKPMIALVDYNGQEIIDSLKAAHWFENKRNLMLSKGYTNWNEKFFGVRLDTHGGRFAQELDYDTSVRILEDWTGVRGEYNIVAYVMGEKAFNMDEENLIVDKVRKHLFGKGVSAANIINTRKRLNQQGFNDAIIVASSGFNSFKCEVMGSINVPVDMIGTGSFLPDDLGDTHATADIISYDGVPRVKVGREKLLED